MKKPNHAGSGQIRIIGGQWRAVNYRCRRAGLRPTTDRVRETLFNWLAPSMIDAHCLDCFAGSGALGWKRCHAMPPAPRYWRWSAASRSYKNLATLKANNGKVVNTNTLAFLSQPGTPHHIVFVDPPFRKGLLEETLSLLENHWLADEALIYVESEVENGLPPVPANWQLYREKSPDRSPTACINARHKEKTMLINLGRLLMLCVWAFCC